MRSHGHRDHFAASLCFLVTMLFSMYSSDRSCFNYNTDSPHKVLTAEKPINAIEKAHKYDIILEKTTVNICRF